MPPSHFGLQKLKRQSYSFFIIRITSLSVKYCLQTRKRFRRQATVLAPNGKLGRRGGDRRADIELGHADGIVAASTFSIRSAIAAGASCPTAVVPYFCDLPPNLDPLKTRAKTGTRFLFVGQGVQRKGFHHLLRAWSKARISNSELVCVCSTISPAFEHLIGEDVTILRGLSAEKLMAEFDRAHVFVMPSLIEGFGLVYLEARRRGAYVIGTRNTGLPDIGADDSQALYTTAGDVGELAYALHQANALVRSGNVDHGKIVTSSLENGFDQYRVALNAGIDAIREKLDG